MKIELELPESGLIGALARTPDLRPHIIGYALHVAVLHPKNLRSLVETAKHVIRTATSAKPVTPAVVLLASRLALVEFEKDENGLCDRLIEIFQRFQTNRIGDDPLTADVFALSQACSSEAGRIRQPFVKFVVELFPSARLAADPEREFFAKALRNLSRDQIEGVIASSVQRLARYPKGRGTDQQVQAEVLRHAKQVAFLITDVWPEKRAEIRSKIDPEILKSFLTCSTAAWKKVIPVLCAK
jgi:hypothetical protein